MGDQPKKPCAGIGMQTATVWMALNGRRYLTKRAAFNASIMYRLRRRDEPEGHDPMSNRDYYTDEQMALFRAIAQRAWRISVARRARAAREGCGND